MHARFFFLFCNEYLFVYYIFSRSDLNKKKQAITPTVHRTVLYIWHNDHQLLLQDINALPLNGHIKRFLCAYLRGCQTYVYFRGSNSSFRKFKQGVQQGGVLSPLLLNLYMSSMPSPPGNILVITYADDSNILNSGSIIEPVVKDFNKYLFSWHLVLRSESIHLTIISYCVFNLFWWC